MILAAAAVVLKAVAKPDRRVSMPLGRWTHGPRPRERVLDDGDRQDFRNVEMGELLDDVHAPVPLAEYREFGARVS